MAHQFMRVETPAGSVYVPETFGGIVYVREKLESVNLPSQPLEAGIPATVVIVGGGAAGNAAAEMLRREGYSAPAATRVARRAQAAGCHWVAQGPRLS